MLLIWTSLLVCLSLTQAKQIPSYVTLCKRTDPNLSECVKKSALEILPRLKDGAPELALPNFNPFRVPEVQLKNSNFQINYKNVELYLTELLQIETVQIKLEHDANVHVSVTIPNVHLVGDYDSSGNLLLLKVDGSGKSDGNFTNVHLEVTASAKIIKKNEKEYLEINDNFEQLDLKVENGSLYFSNLIGGDKKLNELINHTVNENIQVLLEEFKPLLKSVISSVAHSVIKRFFDTFTLDDLFPV